MAKNSDPAKAAGDKSRSENAKRLTDLGRSPAQVKAISERAGAVAEQDARYRASQG